MDNRINLDTIRRIKEHDWKEVCNEIDNRISALERKLRLCRPEELVGLQSKIQALEELKLLPEQILDREDS